MARFITFLANRLRRDAFSGLPLTLLGLAFIYLSFILVDLAEDILDADPLIIVDRIINRLLIGARDPEWVDFFLLVTSAGEWEPVIVLAVLATVFLQIGKESIYIIPLWVVLSGNLAFNWLLKIVAQRARPLNAHYLLSSYSFPSGHAAISVAFYGFLAYIGWHMLKSAAARMALVCGAASIILLIGFSRMYLGVHYASDVAAGYVQGALWLIIGISLSEWRRTSSKKSNE